MRIAYQDKPRSCKDCFARFGKATRCFAGRVQDGSCMLTDKQIMDEMEKHIFDKRRLK